MPNFRSFTQEQLPALGRVPIPIPLTEQAQSSAVLEEEAQEIIRFGSWASPNIFSPAHGSVV
jgi:hypothetical protein